MSQFSACNSVKSWKGDPQWSIVTQSPQGRGDSKWWVRMRMCLGTKYKGYKYGSLTGVEIFSVQQYNYFMTIKTFHCQSVFIEHCWNRKRIRSPEFINKCNKERIIPKYPKISILWWITYSSTEKVQWNKCFLNPLKGSECHVWFFSLGELLENVKKFWWHLHSLSWQKT